jgi:hypothetical protein
MPNTTMLILGAMGVLYFMRNQGAGTDKPGTLASLLGADLSSSGVSAFGGTSSAEVVDSGNANVQAPFNLQGWLENLNLTRDTATGGPAVPAGVAVQLDATTYIPPAADNLEEPTPEIVGTLSAFFAEQGLTVSEQSGMAIRQVGLMGRYDPLDIMTSNYPQIGFVDIESSSFIGGDERREIGDQTVEVLRQAPGPYFVETTVGDDGSTVVTSDINKGASYFSTPNTIVAAVDQGYFAPAPVFVPRSWQQIELESGLTERRAAEIEAAYELAGGRPGLIDDSPAVQWTGGAGTGFSGDIWGGEG